MKVLKAGDGGAKGLGQIDVAMVGTRHLSDLAEKFNKPTRVRVIAAAKKIMAIAKRRELIQHSPFSDVDFNEGLANNTTTIPATAAPRS